MIDCILKVCEYIYVYSSCQTACCTLHNCQSANIILLCNPEYLHSAKELHLIWSTKLRLLPKLQVARYRQQFSASLIPAGTIAAINKLIRRLIAQDSTMFKQKMQRSYRINFSCTVVTSNGAVISTTLLHGHWHWLTFLQKLSSSLSSWKNTNLCLHLLLYCSISMKNTYSLRAKITIPPLCKNSSVCLHKVQQLLDS